ncbi:MAG TPA: secretin N-terminal domain-containing protein [Planctomycetota bacterium]|nr:secretin N-terminal domain-containing protein [Planctomycetota bacterium]
MIGARVSLTMLMALVCASPVLAQEMKPAQTKPDAQAEDAKAKAIREAYEEQLRRERQEVTIVQHNATVDQIVEDFRRQTGWNIVIDKKNIPDDYRVDDLRIEKEKAKTALVAFVSKAELSMEEVSPTLIMLSRPPRLTFNFRDADIKVVIDMIARVSGANIIVSPDVKGQITLSINNVPWGEVLSAVVRTLNYTTVKESFGIIRIIHPDELLKQMDTRVFQLKFISPPSVYTAKIEPTKTLVGQPLVPPTSIDDILNRFVLAKTLQAVLSRDSGNRVLGTLNFDPQNNVFVARDTKIVLDRMAEIIQLLDVEPEQVLLDMKFISTTNKDLLQFGVNWSLGGQNGLTVTSSFLNPSSSTDFAGNAINGRISKMPFGLGSQVKAPGDQLFLTNYDMSMVFRAFKQDQFSRIIQQPELAVVDNTEATIFVGETIAYPEVKTTTNQFGGLEFSLTEAAKSPVKTGFQLFVVPRIVSDANKVILTVIPQNEFLSGPSTGAAVPGFTHFELVSGGQTQSIDLPRLSETQVVTRLVLESGHTAVLGGLVVERSSFEDDGIPVLKDIPLINYLFKQRTDEINKDNLLIFMTPRIIRRGRGPADALQQLLKLREEEEQRSFEESKRKIVPAEPEKK